jgi:hypothetical protein
LTAIINEDEIENENKNEKIMSETEEFERDKINNYELNKTEEEEDEIPSEPSKI